MKFVTHDSRGKPSVTLVLIWFGYVVFLVKYTLAGFILPEIGLVPAMSGVEFATGTGAILLGWNFREYTEKTKVQSNAASDGRYIGREE